MYWCGMEELPKLSDVSFYTCSTPWSFMAVAFLEEEKEVTGSVLCVCACAHVRCRRSGGACVCPASLFAVGK